MNPTDVSALHPKSGRDHGGGEVGAVEILKMILGSNDGLEGSSSSTRPPDQRAAVNREVL